MAILLLTNVTVSPPTTEPSTIYSHIEELRKITLSERESPSQSHSHWITLQLQQSQSNGFSQIHSTTTTTTSLMNCPRVDHHDSQMLILFLPHLLHKYSLHFAGAKLTLFTAPITRAQVCTSIQSQVNLAHN